MKTSETLAIGDVQPGMRLAGDVLDGSGRVLVPKGCELTESMLSGLIRRAIDAVTVERELEEDPAIWAERRARAIAQLDHLFRQAGDGRETRQLYSAIMEFRLNHQS